MKFLAPILLLAGAVCADEPSVKISPQSVECFYDIPKDSDMPVACRVRLHATPSKGAMLWVQEGQQIPDIAATDAKGNVMTGSFREWEVCYDGNKSGCHILVFDFATLPEGDTIIFDTELELPVTPGIQRHEAPSFSTTEKTTCTIGGHQVEIEPLPKSEDAPRELALRITYDKAQEVPEIIICDDEGWHLESQIVHGEYDPATGKTSAIYVQEYNKKEGKIALRTYKPCVGVSGKVKFKASIGRN